MKYVSAMLMVALAGQTPNKDNISAVLNAAGAAIDGEKLDLLLKQVEGKDIGELVQAGRAKLQSVPSGGAAPSAGAGAAAAKEEAAPEPESEEEEEEDMGFSLFD